MWHTTQGQSHSISNTAKYIEIVDGVHYTIECKSIILPDWWENEVHQFQGIGHGLLKLCKAVHFGVRS